MSYTGKGVLRSSTRSERGDFWPTLKPPTEYEWLKTCRWHSMYRRVAETPEFCCVDEVRKKGTEQPAQKSAYSQFKMGQAPDRFRSRVTLIRTFDTSCLAQVRSDPPLMLEQLEQLLCRRKLEIAPFSNQKACRK